MTKDEAVYRLRNAAWLGSDEDREATEQAVETAIEALEREDADGCDGCRYMWMESTQMPCLECKRNHRDMWTRITEMTLEDAIRHAKETAEMMYRRAEIEPDRDECIRCAEEHRQLAMWLSELRHYRKAGRLP